MENTFHLESYRNVKSKKLYYQNKLIYKVITYLYSRCVCKIVRTQILPFNFNEKETTPNYCHC